MSRSPFRLTKTIGRNYSVDPEDVLRTKRILKELGYFETPAYGMTRYPDEPMFKGIEQLQDDFDLNPDGVMDPKGATAEKINEVLNYKTGKPIPVGPAPQPPTITRNRPNQDEAHSNEKGDAHQDKEQIAAIPIIVYEIGAAFSMGIAAAYAWWLSMSAEEKKKVREHINNVQEHGTVDNTHEDECERLLQIDLDTCRAISKRRGKQAAQRCFASAHQRNAACRRGRSVDELPPLDTWNN